MKIVKQFVHYYQKQDFMAFWSTSFSIIVALIIIAVWAWYFPTLPSQLPLFYSLPWGEKQLASTTQFLIIPSLIVLICFINLIITWHLHSSQTFIKRILVSSTSIVAILLFITSLKIIFTFV